MKTITDRNASTMFLTEMLRGKKLFSLLVPLFHFVMLFKMLLVVIKDCLLMHQVVKR